MMRRWSSRTRGDEGMTTAEYAVGTVGACGLAGVLIKMVESEWFGDLVQNVIGKVVHWLPF
jgi:hypothetical protein